MSTGFADHCGKEEDNTYERLSERLKRMSLRATLDRTNKSKANGLHDRSCWYYKMVT